jgi:hypothetical protein
MCVENSTLTVNHFLYKLIYFNETLRPFSKLRRGSSGVILNIRLKDKVRVIQEHKVSNRQDNHYRSKEREDEPVVAHAGAGR